MNNTIEKDARASVAVRRCTDADRRSDHRIRRIHEVSYLVYIFPYRDNSHREWNRMESNRMEFVCSSPSHNLFVCLFVCLFRLSLSSPFCIERFTIYLCTFLPKKKKKKNIINNSMVVEDAVEIDSKKNSRQEVGRILLKGDSITLLQIAQPVRPTSSTEPGVVQ